MALNFAVVTMMTLVAGIIGAKTAPSAELATLPIAMVIIGTAAATIPAAMIMRRLGRKAGMATGLGLGFIGVCFVFFATLQGSFLLLLLGSVFLGLNAAFTQQGRFIILENSNNDQQSADGLTLALMANLIAAVIGPELGTLGEDMVDSKTGFAGSFVFAGGLILCSFCVLMFYQNIKKIHTESIRKARSLSTLVKQPIFILAAGSSAVGYAVMSLVMTAAPISMHEIEGHGIDSTKLVIQTHIIAMFLPSLLSGYLLKKGLRLSLIFSGLVLYLFVIAIGISGAEVVHYWWALLLLGVGWNFLFITSTSLLPRAYSEEERFSAQAANDFLVFGFQAIAAFFAGLLLFTLGWSGVIAIALVLTLVWLSIVAGLVLRRPKILA